MQKSIYLARRCPVFTHDAFVPRWRQHGALAMSKSLFQSMAGYVQSEVIHPAAIAGFDDSFDAIGTIHMRDHERTPQEIHDLQVMEEDEYETFDDAILPHLVMVEETLVVSGPPGGTTACLFFTDAAQAEAAAHEFRNSTAQRVVFNRRLTGPGLETVGTAVPYHAVVEIAAKDLQALGWLLDTQHLWRDADLRTVVRECVMWDRLGR